MAKKREPIYWFGHSKHFIGGPDCEYKLACYIPSSRVIISTVGLWYPERRKLNAYMPKPIGPGKDDLFETFVFNAAPVAPGSLSYTDCCPYEVTDFMEIEGIRCSTASVANKNHMAMVKKYGSNKYTK